MNISKIVKSFGAFALALAVIAPSVVLAQAGPTARIDAPANGSEVIVGESVTFRGSATNATSPSYLWIFEDGTESAGDVVTKTFGEVSQGDDTELVRFRVTDRGQVSFAQINVKVVERDSGVCNPLIIENDIQNPNGNHPRAINVTRTTATIVWETCAPATSRVIFGTTSNEDISDDSAPHYGYPFHPAGTTEKVTRHSVELTGLTPNTTYYFRVLSQR